jgi:hypothetical protein
MTQLQLALEAALRRLPVAAPVGPGIPYETLIPGIARQLSLMQPNDHKLASPATTRRKLIALKKRAEALSKDMSAAVHLPLQQRLAIIAIAYAETCKLPRPARTGAPQKQLALRVACTVAEHYYALTGKKPTRITPCEGGKACGPFVAFLTEIFKLLGIKASAENQAKASIKFMAKTYPDN